ncbi:MULTISPECIES: YopX family protein [Bacillus]|uniref:YopX family protein n=1 Tax=Bacillus TaxID=1386 RepID=UPI00050622E1|nr:MULTISPECIES: YopX family protein [Bacillus subtilis group]KFM92354.1 yopX family protein [Bacillus paralicheniformis]MBU8745716.1 YopX family protein [Bacillus paralicheniformis]MEC2170333.1 YopX family protein [Bacillus paralicheniformis]MED1242296.1 YopX family protein [Bacillus paralicheniformis]MED4369477.1 YopX family protein [Bacillus licheniformis]
MREIKFRYALRDRVTGEIFERIHNLNDIETGNEVAYDFDSPRFIDCELIGRYEYTGLKDKNMREIYEGDIVQGSHRSQRDDEIILIEQQVHFLNGCYMFGNWNAHEYFNKHRNIEVIGNIYQNPNLLLEAKK